MSFDSNAKARSNRRKRYNFTARFIVGIIVLAAISLFFIYSIGLTVVRDLLYDNFIEFERQHINFIAYEVDTWFAEQSLFVEHMAAVWETVGVEPGETGFGPDPIGASFLEQSDILVGVFVGFENGWHVNSSGWIPPEGFHAPERPWFQIPEAAGGEVAISLPYVRLLDGDIVASMGVWKPDIIGMEAVVAVDIRLRNVFDLIAKYDFPDGGYIMLLGPDLEIIVHPNSAYMLSPEHEEANLRYLQGGEAIADIIYRGIYYSIIEHALYGESYVFAAPLPTVDWTLVTIIPTAPTETVVAQYLSMIMATFFIFFILLLIALMIFVLGLSKRSRRLEEEIHTQEADERVRLTLEADPLSVSWFDSSRTLIDCNQAALRAFGVKNKEDFIKDFNERFEVFSPPTQPCGESSDKKKVRLFDEVEKEGFYTSNWDHLTASGEDLPMELTMVRIDYSDTFVFVVYLRDLREERANEEKEHEHMEYVNALFQASPMFIDVWDDEFNLIDCNDKICELLGVPTKEEFLDNLAEKYNPEFQPCGTRSVDLYMEKFQIGLDEGYVKYDWTHLDVNGNEVPLEVTYVRIYRKGKRLMVGYNYDLRDIKRAQENRERVELAEESSRAKSAFLARMSHEIRTPITAVMGIAEIELQDPKLSPNIEEAFAKIYISANQLLRIVNDILDLSKIQAGKMSLHTEQYELASVLVDVSHMHFALLSGKDLELILDIDENLPVHLVGDSLRIVQVLSNILSNALKYTDSGSVTLSVKHEKNPSADSDDDVVIFSVKDTGLGMTSQQIAELGNEYSRYHEHRSRTVEGTGLGMSIVYSLLEMMDAEISVESEVGVGTTVVCRIPQHVVGSEVFGKELADSLEHFEEASRIAAKRFTIDPEFMPYGRVLVVDDIDANLYVAKSLLAFYGLSIDTCKSGIESIRKIEQGNVYDIVFMDYMMPGLNGVETLHKLREIGYHHPVVALTANAMIGQAEEFAEAGFDGFISKPIQSKKLNAILVKYIKDKQPPEIIKAAEKAAKKAVSRNIDEVQRDPALIETLKREFRRSHEHSSSVFTEALESGDLSAAHHLVHAIKGAAGLIFEETLVRLAQATELSLANKKLPATEQIVALNCEIRNVLDRIGVVEKSTVAVPFNRVRDEALLNELESLLSCQSAECIRLLDKLSQIEGFELLCEQIEGFELAEAFETLKALKSELDMR
ncbi:MAG: ATP-binding protein [Oscillospiraceae bacterium]|nr:ATP-binding protein [Oscillospiraceae bacterium]